MIIISPLIKLYKSDRPIGISLISIIINVCLTVSKVITGMVGHSYALLADAVDSLSDILSSIIVLSGLKISKTPPDESHPYGHGKAEPLATVVVAMALISIAIGICIKSKSKIFGPHYTPEPFTLFILIFFITIKEAMYRITYRIGEDEGSSVLKADAWHHRTDAMTSLAAFIGISISLSGGKKFVSADAWAALVVAFVIIWNAIRLLLPAVGEIMDAAPDPKIEIRVRDIAAKVPGVLGLDKCFVRKMGMEFYVDLHVIVSGSISVRTGHSIGHSVKASIKQGCPRVSNVLIHIEPDAPS